jgi:arylsulfatase A-like enzyme
MSDNGVMFGEHQMLLKGPAFYEELIRTPLIFWGPSRIHPGNDVDSLVSSLDLFPTFCRFAGAEPPSRLSGIDLTPLLLGETDSLRDAVYLQYEHKGATDRTVPMRGIVTKNYKYVRYLEGGEELYDLRTDALETKNLIGDDEHQQLAKEMRRKLDDWLANTEIDHKLP